MLNMLCLSVCLVLLCSRFFIGLLVGFCFGVSVFFSVCRCCGLVVLVLFDC